MRSDPTVAASASPVTVDAAIRRAEATIATGAQGYRSESPRLDAELLLAAIRRCDRARLLADLREPLVAGDWEALGKLARRRAAGEPLAYLLGHSWFHGIELRVNPSVLIPRPETELLVDWALGWLRRTPAAGRDPDSTAGLPSRHIPGPADGVRVIDVGTGSGAIVLALAAALRSRTPPTGAPEPVLFASDISEAALATCRDNAERLGLDSMIQLLHADLLPRGKRPFGLVLANLPYVGLDERSLLRRDVAEFEPPGALFAGPDGLALIQRLLEALPGCLAPGGAAALEIGYAQGRAVLALARRCFPDGRVQIHPDPAGHDRMLTIETGP